MNNRVNNFYTQSLPASSVATSPEGFANYSHENQYMGYRSSFPEYMNKVTSPTDDLMRIRSITLFAKRFFELRNIKFRQVILKEKDKISAKVYINEELVGEFNHPSSFNRCRVLSAVKAFEKDYVEVMKQWMIMHKKDLENYLGHSNGNN